MSAMLSSETSELSAGVESAAPVQTPAPKSGADYNATMRTLLSTMMLGQTLGMHEEAQSIFKFASAIVGDSRPLRISLAFASSVMGDAAPAKELLSEGVDEWPNAEMSKLSLAMSLKLAGDLDWKQLPEQMLASSTEPAVRSMAQRMLSPPESQA